MKFADYFEVMTKQSWNPSMQEFLDNLPRRSEVVTNLKDAWDKFSKIESPSLKQIQSMDAAVAKFSDSPWPAIGMAQTLMVSYNKYKRTLVGKTK